MLEYFGVSLMSAPIIIGGATTEVVNKQPLTMVEISEKLPFIKNAKLIIINPLEDRSKITSYLTNKSGIYCWVNKLNLKFYIGSGNKLNIRVNSYFNPSTPIKNTRAINSGILKYDLMNFMLVILEFTEPAELIVREQLYIDTLSPPYNVLKKANSLLGFKPSALTRND